MQGSGVRGQSPARQNHTHRRRVLLTQREVAELWGVSKTVPFQIEQRALRKLRQAIEINARAAGVSVREWLYGDGA